MNKKNGLRLFAALLCLLLAMTVFVACNTTPGGDETTDGGTQSQGGSNGENNTENGDETTSDLSKETILISDYALTIPNKENDAVNSAATVLITSAIKLGTDFANIGSDYTAYDQNLCEILVGETNRPESAAALEELGGKVGYVIKKIGNKIVINASAPGLLDEATRYFATTYMDLGTNGSFTIPSDLLHVNNDMNGISLIESDGTTKYTLIYSNSLDITSGADDKDKTDYVVPNFIKLQSSLQSRTGVASFPFSADTGTPSVDSFEILLGRTNRPETETFLSTLAPNEYGYGVVGNKLVIAGWSALTIDKAVTLFMENLHNYVGEEDGKKTFLMVEADKTVASYDAWNVNIPLYSGGKLNGAELLFSGGYQAYYIETTADEYRTYRSELETAGYKLHQENQIGDNLYATYYNATTMIHAYYVNYNKSVHVVIDDMANVVLPQNEDPCEKITDMTFTMMGLDDAAGNFGNCFIITLEDGSFILHDGGGDKGTIKNADRDELYSLLKRLNKRKDGKIVIAAWFISHQHWDHFKNAYDMFSAYYRQGLLKVEKVVFNVPNPTSTYNSYNPGTYVENGYLNNLRTWFGTEQVIMHTGQTIQIRNLKIEALYTCDDIYPDSIVKFNNSSFVQRFEVGFGATKQTMIIMGDIEEVASDRLVKMYGDELKCDIMQVAHHGYGGSVELYKRYSPSVVLWPKDKVAVNNQIKDSATGYYPTINKSLYNQKNVVLVVIADDGHKTIRLPVTGLTEDRTQNQNNCVFVYPREDGLPT